MTELKNRIGQAWRRHPVIDGILSGAAFVCVSLLLINFALPAWAATFPVGNLFIVKLDDWAPWAGIGVTVLIWWEARRARSKATEAATLAAAAGKEIKAVAVQIDGLLADRDKAKVKEGEAKEKLVGEDTAATLAKGQAQGRASERASAAAAHGATPNGAPAASVAGKLPLPVADDRTAGAAERSAKALECTAAATEDKKS